VYEKKNRVTLTRKRTFTTYRH